jgi:hypothetical protein
MVDELQNNKAIVVKLGEIKSIEGADKIVSASIMLNGVPITQIVTGIGSKEGTIMVYFDSNMCLSDKFIDDDNMDLTKYLAKSNVVFNCYPVIEGQKYIDSFKDTNKQIYQSIIMLSPEDYSKRIGLAEYSVVKKEEENKIDPMWIGTPKFGRVRVVKLKGVISNGLVIEINKFKKYFNTEKEFNEFMKEGNAFTHIGDIEICHKYTPLPARNSGEGNMYKGYKKEPNRMIDGIFHFHFDTDQLLRNINKLNPDDFITISRKIHGTSAICANILVKRKLSLVEKLMKFIGFVKVNDKEYDYIYASRGTIKNNRKIKPELMNKNDIWISSGQKYFYGKLYKGETIYYEIVGYMPSGKMIQKNYDYGCQPKEYKIAVYRITMTNEDGNVIEYSWNMMKDRCKELSVDMVQEFYYGKAGLMFLHEYPVFKFNFKEPNEEELLKFKSLIEEAKNSPQNILIYPTELEINIEEVNTLWRKNFLNKLKEVYLEKDCWDSMLPNKMPDEGIVLRIEKGIHIQSFKLKSEKFLLIESKAKDDGAEDTEETESVTTQHIEGE